jgi:hypothetical protein
MWVSMIAAGDINKDLPLAIEAAGLCSFVDGIHHVFVCFEGFNRFPCRKECLAPFLMCSKQQGLEIPAKELTEVLDYGKHHVCIILTHHDQVFTDLTNEY